MCLIAFALDARDGVPLLLAANRDEFFDRPTAGLHRWSLPDGSQVLAGRDLREGGTWLGASASGRIAMLTNVRSADMPSARRSRGELPTQWLGGHFETPEAMAAALAPGDYGGFNLVVGDVLRGHWTFISNRHPDDPHGPQAPAIWRQTLQPGVYGLSNASLNSDWPKSRRLRSALADVLPKSHGPAQDWQPILQQALGIMDHAPAHALPDTGVPQSMERALSSPFVRMPERGYGTRSSLLMSVWQERNAWTLTMDEWQHEVDGQPAGQPVWHPAARRQERLRFAS